MDPIATGELARGGLTRRRHTVGFSWTLAFVPVVPTDAASDWGGAGARLDMVVPGDPSSPRGGDLLTCLDRGVARSAGSAVILREEARFATLHAREPSREAVAAAAPTPSTWPLRFGSSATTS